MDYREWMKDAISEKRSELDKMEDSNRVTDERKVKIGRRLEITKQILDMTAAMVNALVRKLGVDT